MSTNNNTTTTTDISSTATDITSTTTDISSTTTDITSTTTDISSTTAIPLLNTTTKKPLHISINVNYNGFIKYVNDTNIIIVPSLTTTKISKYIINVGKLVTTSTSSTISSSSTTSSSSIPTITPTVTPGSTTTTKAGIVKPTSIPQIRIYAEDNGYYSGDIYLTYRASGAVYESDSITSLPGTLTPAYDNSKFVFSSKYDWYYIKNGEKVEIKGGYEHEISLSVLASSSIYIKVSSKTTQPPSNTSTVLTDTTTAYTAF